MVIDFLLLAVLLGCLAFGLKAGVVRQFFVLAGVYGGLIVASYLHVGFRTILAIMAGQASSNLYLEFLIPIAYLLLLLITTLVATLGSYYASATTKLENAEVDRAGGTAVALVWSLFLIAGLLMTGESLAAREWAVMRDSAAGFHAAFQDSQLRTFLLRDLPLFPYAVQPWAPEAV